MVKVRLAERIMVFMLALTMLCFAMPVSFAETDTDTASDAGTEAAAAANTDIDDAPADTNVSGEVSAAAGPDAGADADADDADADADVYGGEAAGTGPDTAAEAAEEGQPGTADGSAPKQEAAAVTDPGPVLKAAAGTDEEDAGTYAGADVEAELLAQVGTHGIPVLYVNVDESTTTIEQMNSDEKHETKCTGNVDIIVPEDCTDVFGQASYPDMKGLELKYIRGRGNSTWTEEKKPYKLKFETAQSFFGMGSDTEWALMANANDVTMLDNIITAWLGEQMGFAYSPTGVPVELVMTGEEYGEHYLGMYVLSELVNRGSSRVDIEKLGKNVTATEEEAGAGEANISGGYLLSVFNEMQDGDEPDNNHFTTDSELEFMFQDPEYEDTELTEGQKAQLEYIRNYIQTVDDLIAAKTIDHDALEEMMDLQSLADYWMIQEFCRNGDAFLTHSTYLYKPRGDKLYWGPLWDFDLGWEYIEDDESISGLNYTEMLWTDRLRDRDPEFRAIVQERWEVLKGHLQELIAEGGILDQYKEAMEEAWEANRKLWPALDDDTGSISYDDRIRGLKTFIQKRMDAVDENMKNDLDKVFVTVRFIADGKEVAVLDEVRLKGSIDEVPAEPKKSGYVFKGWYEEKTGTPINDADFVTDLTFVAEYIPESEATAPEQLFLDKYEDWVAIQDRTYPMPYSQIFPEGVTDSRVTYTSSDESIASIRRGQAVLHRTGDVVIKASLYNGISKNVLLHIYDSTQTEKQPVTAVKPRSSSYVMDIGEVTQILLELYPKNVPLDYQYFEFESSDDSIAGVDFMGVVTAAKAGTVTIRYAVIDTNENVVGSGTVKVTVRPAAEDPDDNDKDNDPDDNPGGGSDGSTYSGDSDKRTGVRTGDGADLMGQLGIFGVSAAGLLAVLFVRRRGDSGRKRGN